MAVGIGAIALSEVCDEIGLTGAGRTLQGCIDNANSGGYNGTYYTAPATSLAEFRGYSNITPTIAVSPRSINLGTSVASTTVAITSNTTWFVTDDRAWISTSGVSGSGDDSSVTITVTANNVGSTSARTGTVTFTTNFGSGDVSDTVTVNQAGTA